MVIPTKLRKRGINMNKCPNCNKELTQEMIDANMCWECGFILDKTLADEINDSVDTINEKSDLKKEELNNLPNYTKKEHPLSQVLKSISVILAIVGTIGSISICQSEFSIFIIFEIVILIQCIFLFSFGEIIQLLYDIKNK